MVLALAAGCSKPKPPTLTPRSAQVSAIKPQSVELSLVLAAHNPNSFPIVVSTVSGSFELQDGTPLGSAQSTASFTIPSQADRDLAATLDVRFSSLAALTPYCWPRAHLKSWVSRPSKRRASGAMLSQLGPQ